MRSLFKSLDYGQGKITCLEEDLSAADSLASQIALLREDLLQVEYKAGAYVLDVGWYPSGDETGAFGIVIVENGDWESPLYRWHTRDRDTLKTTLEEAVTILGHLSSGCC